MRSPLLAGSLAGLALLLAACGGGTGSAATAAPAAATAPAPAATTAPATAAASPASSADAAAGGSATAAVALGDTSLGKVLVDGKAMTLYVFMADSGGTSTCYDACAGNWPPLTGKATPGAGLDAADFGTTTRKDGSTQATFYGMPLYLFAGDTAPGDVKGQGLAGKWYVVGADGKPIK